MSTGSIEIHFVGIAVHLINDPPIPNANIPASVPHRVAIISNSADLHLGNPLTKVTPHQLQVISGQAKIPPIPSFKATFSIQNPSDVPVNYTDCYDCAVLNLKKVAEKNDLRLNAGLVSGAINPDNCSVVFFDVTQGTFDAYQYGKGASAAMLTIKTDGDPQMTILDRASGTTQTVRFTSPAILEITNHGGPGVDANVDFLLSYLAADQMLSPDKVPHDPNRCPPACQRPSLPDLGPGCSNSNYP